MKKILIGFILGLISILTVSKVGAVTWNRLENLNECIGLRWGEVCMVYDKIEKVNCYVYYFGSNTAGMDCMKAEK